MLKNKKKYLLALLLLGFTAGAVTTPIVLTSQANTSKKIDYIWNKTLPGESIYRRADGTYTTNKTEAEGYVEAKEEIMPKLVTIEEASHGSSIIIDGNIYNVNTTKKWDKDLPIGDVYLKDGHDHGHNAEYTTDHTMAEGYVTPQEEVIPNSIVSFPGAQSVTSIVIDGEIYETEGVGTWDKVLPEGDIWLKKGSNHGEGAEYTTKVEEAEGYVQADPGMTNPPTINLDPELNGNVTIDETDYLVVTTKKWDKDLPIEAVYLLKGSVHGPNGKYTTDYTKAEGYQEAIDAVEPNPIVLPSAQKDKTIIIDDVTYRSKESSRKWSSSWNESDLWLKSGVLNENASHYTTNYIEANGYVAEVKATLYNHDVDLGGSSYDPSQFSYENTVPFEPSVKPTWNGNEIASLLPGDSIDETLYAWNEIKAPKEVEAIKPSIKGITIDAAEPGEEYDTNNWTYVPQFPGAVTGNAWYKGTQITTDNGLLLNDPAGGPHKDGVAPDGFNPALEYDPGRLATQENGEWKLQFDGHDIEGIIESGLTKPSNVSDMSAEDRLKYQIDTKNSENYDSGKLQIDGKWIVKYNSYHIVELDFTITSQDHSLNVTNGLAPTNFDIKHYNAGNEEVKPSSITIDINLFNDGDNIKIDDQQYNLQVEYVFKDDQSNLIPSGNYYLGLEESKYVTDITKAKGYIPAEVETVPSEIDITSYQWKNGESITIDNSNIGTVYTYVVEYKYDSNLPNDVYEDKDGNYTTTKEEAKDYVEPTPIILPETTSSPSDHEYVDANSITIDGNLFIYSKDSQYKKNLPIIDENNSYYLVSKDIYSSDPKEAKGYEGGVAEFIPSPSHPKDYDLFEHENKIKIDDDAYVISVNHEYDKELPEEVYLVADGEYTTNYENAGDYILATPEVIPNSIGHDELFKIAKEIENKIIIIDDKEYMLIEK